MLHTNQLIIIGGPSCAGKSFLIKRIQQGELPRLCGQLGILNPSSWRYVLAAGLKHIDQQIVERLVVHYDFYSQQSKENEFNHLCKLIDNSDRIIVVTLNVPRSILVKRNNSRILKYYLIYLLSFIGVKRKNQWNKSLPNRIHYLWKKRKVYKHGESDLLYERWFKYLDQFNEIDHWLLDYSESHTMSAYPYKTDKLCFSDVQEVIDS